MAVWVLEAGVWSLARGGWRERPPVRRGLAPIMPEANQQQIAKVYINSVAGRYQFDPKLLIDAVSARGKN